MRLEPGVALVVTALLASQAGAQGLAAAAQREKERRAQKSAQGSSSSKTYGDEELKTNPGTLANDPSIPPANDRSLEPAAVNRPARTLTSVPAGRVTSRESDATEAIPRGGAKDESYWRARAAGLRAAVASAEKKLKELERDVNQAGPAIPGPLGVPCQAGIEVGPGDTVGADLRDRSRRTKTCNSLILDQTRARASAAQVPAAREALERAQKALANLDEDARRAGAAPGWVR